MFLLQSVVMFLVVASNVQFHWTPNPYIPALIGVGLAYGLTLLLNGAQGWIGRNKQAKRLH